MCYMRKQFFIAILVFVLSAFNTKGQTLCPWQAQNSWLVYSFHLSCEGSSFTTTFNNQLFENFLWNNGSTSNTMTMTVTGWYWVDLTLNGCTGRDSIFVLFSTPPVLELGNDTTICEGEPFVLVADTGFSPYTSYIWNNGSLAPTATVNNAGTYTIDVYNGCRVSDTIKVQVFPKAIPDLGPDNYICVGAKVLLDPQVEDLYALYTWQDNSHLSAFEATQPGLYHVAVTNECGTHRDSIILLASSAPVVDLGPDTSLCVNTNLMLFAGGNNLTDDYKWNNNSIDSFLLVKKAGTYWVKVSRGGCEVTDTILITSIQKPVFSLGPDKVICDNSSVKLEPDNLYSNLQWQNGSTDPVYTATQPGIYFLKAFNSCGSTTDTILLKPGICKLYIPSAFTPNNDGRNDIFRIPPELGMTLKEMSIYNRWGQKVFTTTDITKGWDGKIKGSLVPAGVYVYLIKGAFGNEDIVTSGTITLIR